MVNYLYQKKMKEKISFKIGSRYFFENFDHFVLKDVRS